MDLIDEEQLLGMATTPVIPEQAGQSQQPHLESGEEHDEMRLVGDGERNNVGPAQGQHRPPATTISWAATLSAGHGPQTDMQTTAAAARDTKMEVEAPLPPQLSTPRAAGRAPKTSSSNAQEGGLRHP